MENIPEDTISSISSNWVNIIIAIMNIIAKIKFNITTPLIIYSPFFNSGIGIQ